MPDLCPPFPNLNAGCTISGSYLQRNIRVLANDGRIAIIAFLKGSKVDNFDFMQVMTRRLTITGSTLRPQSDEDKARIGRGVLTKGAWDLFSQDGPGKVVIDGCWGLDDATDAHKRMEIGGHIGKLVLAV